jgi:DhnA family fructose-bisphosphate aldolase class Ia
MFSAPQFLPPSVVDRVTDIRVHDPEFAWRSARRRIRRDQLAPDGKLNLLAADHPARNVTKVGNNALAMADRHEYLARILRILAADRVDGVMATMDILEDLLILDGLLRESGGAPLLDGKLAIASLNRGGLAGSAWELDDPVTGPSPAACQECKLDGVKLLLRVDETNPDSLKTLQACARAVSEASARGLPVFLEPLPVARTEKGFTVVKTAEALARLAGVASALGDSSRHVWLKLPYCEDYRTVARSTTQPILLLGGESAGDASPFLGQLRSALEAGSNVRGALVGRNVLYPGAEDPLAIAEAAGGIIHEDWTVEQAIRSCETNRGRDMDRIARHFEIGQAKGGNR